MKINFELLKGDIIKKICNINSNLNANNDENFAVKLSAGYYCSLSNDSINNLFINADKALYHAKTNKNFKCIRFEEKNNE